MKIVLSFFESAANAMLDPNQFREVLSTGYSGRKGRFCERRKWGVFMESGLGRDEWERSSVMLLRKMDESSWKDGEEEW